MSVVGVRYAPAKASKPVESADEGYPIDTFVLARANGGTMRQLYDCDACEWFALIDNLGALVARIGELMKEGSFPLHDVKYATPMDRGTPYFGGMLGGTTDGYCVATRSKSGNDVRILEVSTKVKNLAWHNVRVEGGFDTHCTCACLLEAKWVLSCNIIQSTEDLHTIAINVRILERECDTWKLGASVEVTRVMCRWNTLPSYYDAENEVCLRRVQEVCAVPNTHGGVTVVFAMIAQDTNGPVSNRVYTVDINLPPVPAPAQALVTNHIQIVEGDIMIGMHLVPSMSRVYMTYGYYMKPDFMIAGVVNTNLRHTIKHDHGQASGFATLPADCVLITESEAEDVDPFPGYTPRTRGVLRTIHDKEAGSVATTIARTEFIADIAQPQPDEFHHTRDFDDPDRVYYDVSPATMTFDEVGFVWMDYVVNLRGDDLGNTTICFARCFAARAKNAHHPKKQRHESLELESRKNSKGGFINLKRNKPVSVR